MKIFVGPKHDPAVIKKLNLDTQPVDMDMKSSEAQEQTKNTFSFKWGLRDSYESDEYKKRTQDWLFEKYCGGDSSKVDEWLSGGGKTILDAGCGSGFSALLFFGENLKNNQYVGVDISDAVETGKARFDEHGLDNYIFAQASISSMPVTPNSVDLIFSEGVFHHTDDTKNSMQRLAKALTPGGYYLFYVYKKKSAIREFTDDHIRNALKEMDDEQVWEAMKPLTQLGIALGEINAKIDVPDIPFLGITAGEYDVQRFIYWHIMKAFYDPTISIEEMNHVNYDWYRPMNCHRHTPEEVRSWCEEVGLNVESLLVQNSGMTVVARKPL